MRALCYERPASAEAIVKLLGDGVALLAGGTDLLAQIRSRLVRPTLLVDIKGAEELRQLRRAEDGLSIGAAVFLNRLLEERDTLAGYRALTEAVADLASYPIRNRATLAGNVANASPCADTVPPLVVMDARVELLGPAGTREVAVVDLITGNRETTRAADELVTRVIVPPLPHGTWSGFLKRKRVRGHDLALASAALLRDPERRSLRLSVGSCSPRPVLVELDDMYGKPDAEEAVRRCQAGIQPIDDVRASIEYRRDQVAVMVRRLFVEMGGAA